MIKLKSIMTACVAVAMLSGVTSTQAALVNFEITGTIDWAAGGNSFGVSLNDTITASGVFDDAVLSAGTGEVDFTVSGNDMTIDVNGTIFTDSMDVFGGALMYLDNGALDDLQYGTEESIPDNDFNSFYTDFSGGPYGAATFTGIWSTTVTTSAVPVPAAVWLFGSGLLGLIGFARRKS